MKRTVVVLCAFALIGLYGEDAHAQMKFGAQASFATEVDFGVGARAMFDSPVEGLTIVPTADIFFPSTGSGVSSQWIEVSGNAHYGLPIEGNSSILPYAGGGLGLVHHSVSISGFGSSSSTDLGLNLLGGMQFLTVGTFVPFAEVRYNTVGAGQLILSGGINF